MSLEIYRQWLILKCDSPSTVDTYYRQVKYYTEIHGEVLTQDSINAYFVDLRLNKSTATFNLAVNALIKYAQCCKVTIDFPKQKTVDVKLPKFFLKEDLEKDILPNLHLACPKNYDQADIILRVLFYTGIRRKELLTLKRENISFKKNTMEIKNTKGNVDRLIPIEAKLKKQILTYFDRYPEKTNAFNISLQQLVSIIKNINDNLNLDYKLTPHLFRHSSGRHLTRISMNQHHIKDLLGHKSIKTTEKYTSSTFEMIQQTYNEKIKEI